MLVILVGLGASREAFRVTTAGLVCGLLSITLAAARHSRCLAGSLVRIKTPAWRHTGLVSMIHVSLPLSP